jgi:hypothetical protein
MDEISKPTEWVPLKKRYFDRYGKQLDVVFEDYFIVKKDSHIGIMLNNMSHNIGVDEELKNLILETVYGEEEL